MLGLPYMGSKRKIAKEIVNHILYYNPQVEYIYDLFGGGGAVTFEFAKRNQIKGVYYNELNTGIVELLKYIRDHGVSDNFYSWVTKEEFDKHKYDNDWYGGLLKTCWSFGSKQKDYLYGKSLEEQKFLLHDIIVNKSIESRDKIEDMWNLKLPDYIFDVQGINNRRLHVGRYIRKHVKKAKELDKIGRLGEIRHLERMENLNKISDSGLLCKINLSNKSYEHVEIDNDIKNTVIYMDPPYENTMEYEIELDYNKLYNYIQDSDYKIYLSSYNYDLPVVKEIHKTSSLSAVNNNKKTIEKIFCNKPNKEELRDYKYVNKPTSLFDFL